MRCVIAVALGLICSVCQAQVEIKTEQAKALSGLESPSVVGELVLFANGSPKVKSVGVIYVEAVGEVSVEATDEKRQPVQVSRVSDGVYLVDRPGSTWVEVSEYGEVELAGGQRRKILLDRKTAVVVVDDPTPPPGPGPGPSPPGPGPSPTPDLFDGLAGKVSQLSRNMDLQKKLQLIGVLDTIAQKMDRGEFLQIKQCADYLNTNRPPCTPQAGCAELYNFMAADARGRVLSFEQAKQYYRELAKGLRQ
jgi:hypothetical protein